VHKLHLMGLYCSVLMTKVDTGTVDFRSLALKIRPAFGQSDRTRVCYWSNSGQRRILARADTARRRYAILDYAVAPILSQSCSSPPTYSSQLASGTPR
jgi:hypothetical protein